MNLKKLGQFHKTRWGYLIFGLVELAMAYGFLNWALDTGDLWWWAAAGFLLIDGLHNLALVVWRRKK